jgi:hypothetical protein
MMLRFRGGSAPASSDPADELSRGQAGEPARLPRETGLVGVAGGRRDLRQPAGGAVRFELPDHVLEPEDPLQRLRPVSDVVREPPLELAFAEGDALRDFGDRRGAPRQQRHRVADQRIRLASLQPSGELAVQCVEGFLLVARAQERLVPAPRRARRTSIAVSGMVSSRSSTAGTRSSVGAAPGRKRAPTRASEPPRDAA